MKASNCTGPVTPTNAWKLYRNLKTFSTFVLDMDKYTAKAGHTFFENWPAYDLSISSPGENLKDLQKTPSCWRSLLEKFLYDHPGICSWSVVVSQLRVELKQIHLELTNNATAGEILHLKPWWENLVATAGCREKLYRSIASFAYI